MMDAPGVEGMNGSRLLNASDVAEIIGMRVDYVYALARRDAIPYLRFGRSLRFRPEAIDDWLRAGERGSLEREDNGPGAVLRSRQRRR
jgi:excisionase family DNA binding protein